MKKKENTNETAALLTAALNPLIFIFLNEKKNHVLQQLFIFVNKIFSFYLEEKIFTFSSFKSVKIKMKNWNTTGASKSQSMGIEAMSGSIQNKNKHDWNGLRCKTEGKSLGIWFNFEYMFSFCASF